MGTFFVIAAAEPLGEAADQLFQSGLKIAHSLNYPSPGVTGATQVSRAASFPRQNGSGNPVVCDPAARAWLLAIGTWFHSQFANWDVAQLLQRYLEVGAVRLGQELEGFFTVVIGDWRTNETIVITDIVGSCHCFVRWFPQAVALSGSSLLLAGLQNCTLDPVACQEFLHTGIIYEDRSLFKEIRKLGPAAIFRFSPGSCKQERYWEPSALRPESLDGSPAAAAVWEALTGATHKIAQRFAYPVCDLTGGYDSRSVLAAFLAERTNLATTVTGADNSPDVLVSQGLAKLLGLKHLHFTGQEPLSFSDLEASLVLTDGECDLVEYSRVRHIHESLAKRFDVSINGSFGEIARGYWWELLVPRTGVPEKLDSRKLAAARYAPREGSLLFPPELRLDLVQHFSGMIERANSGLFSRPNTFQMDHAYLALRMQRWQGRIASSTNRLWPCISPFMFRSALEAMLQAKTGLRKRSLLVRRMLNQFHPLLAQFPLEHGYPAQPVTWRTLLRFRPLLSSYAHKGLQRLGWRKEASASVSATRLQLWANQNIQDLLNPASMRAIRLMDRSKVASFLSDSRQERFADQSVWQRLLSLEYTLWRLHALG